MRSIRTWNFAIVTFLILLCSTTTKSDAGVEDLGDNTDNQDDQEKGIVAESWNKLSKNLGFGGLRKYLDSFDVKNIFSHSGEVFKKSLDSGLGLIGLKSLITVPLSKSYLYSSGAIRTLAYVEKDIYQAMSQYADEVQVHLNKMKLYMKDYEQSSVNVVDVSQDERDYMVVANPLIGHRLIRRFAKDLKEIISPSNSKKRDALWKGFLKAKPINFAYPTVEGDYVQSTRSLLRIQKYYNLNATYMAIGKLGDLSTGFGLDARHAFDIGIQADILKEPHRPNLYSSTIEWLELSLEMLDQDQAISDVDPGFREEVNKKLQQAVLKHDHACSTKTWVSDLEYCFSALVKGQYGKKKPSDRIKASIGNQINSAKFHKETSYSLHTRRNFINVCSGKDLQTQEEKSKLFCWYEHKKHPYLTIAPAKMEMVNASPELYQIYDLLGPKKIEAIIKAATPKLMRSHVLNTKDPNSDVLSDVRTSSQTWIYDEEGKQLDFDGISRQIEYATGLNVRNKARKGKGIASEVFQIASYRSSHHYEEHLDALIDERRTKENGDRIATVMFYLSDIEEGGKTGFPVMGIAATPVAGSAMFWHNLLKNGEIDSRTWHGGCPVIHGVKWVCNKWILLNENFDKRLCSLDPNE